MSFQAEPHYEIAAAELAAWIEEQGLDLWWTVDGDRVLNGMLSLPCPGDELADAFRRVGRPLLVLDPKKSPAARGQAITRKDLDALVSHLGETYGVDRNSPQWVDDRFFYLSWKGNDIEWMMREDLETTEAERREAALEQGEG